MFGPSLVHEFLRFTAGRYPDKEALVCGGERWTYRALDRASDVTASVLQDMGVLRHHRAAIYLDNSSESVISLYGVLKAGGAFVMLNGTMKSKKLAYILKDSGATVLVAHASKASVVREAFDELGSRLPVLWVGDGHGGRCAASGGDLRWDEAVAPGGGGTEVAAKNLHGSSCIDVDLATLIYTSGSTGEPKGVISTHHNMVSAAKSIIKYIDNTSDDRVICLLPLSFDYGLYQVIMAMMYGGTVVIEKSFMYPIKILETIQRERVTGFPLVPTVAAFLLNMQNLDKYDLSSIRYITNTGAALPVEHIRRLEELFPDARIFSMYGLTECKRVAFLPPEELARRPSSVGKAIPNCEVFVVDENGNDVPPGVEGELVIRGSNVMRGYWNAPELTAKVYRDGFIPGEKFLYSGDIFRKDKEGFLYFVGRKDDLIKTRGERVGPKEVEYALVEIAGVAEAAVIGVPDEIMGQAIKAFLVRWNGANLNENDVLKYCFRRLEPFMVPKHIEFVNELPKTPNGKIDKKALKSLGM